MSKRYRTKVYWWRFQDEVRFRVMVIDVRIKVGGLIDSCEVSLVGELMWDSSVKDMKQLCSSS